MNWHEILFFILQITVLSLHTITKMFQEVTRASMSAMQKTHLEKHMTLSMWTFCVSLKCLFENDSKSHQTCLMSKMAKRTGRMIFNTPPLHKKGKEHPLIICYTLLYFRSAELYINFLMDFRKTVERRGLDLHSITHLKSTHTLSW